MRDVRCPVFFVMGTTGSGKSEVAVRLAMTLRDAYSYEQTIVVNCDVMQFYHDLPIATNKPSTADMRGVPHYFIGFLSPHNTLTAPPEQPYPGYDSLVTQEGGDESVAPRTFHIHDYVKHVSAFLEVYFTMHPHSAAIICGGTNYYLQSMLCTDMLVDDEMKVVQTTTRKDDDDEAVTGEALWQRLHEIDASCAERYHPHDTRRLRRLLEIHASTGKLPSDIFHTHTPTLRYGAERTFVLWLQRSELTASLDARVDEMVRRGLVEEARAFFTQHGGVSSSLVEAIGYKEFAAAWRSGGTESDAVAAVKAHTRRYARQQTQWWRNRCLPLLRRVNGRHVLQLEMGGKHDIDHVDAALQLFLTDGNVYASIPSDYLTCPLADITVEPNTVKREYCEVCEMAVFGAAQMEVHLRSRRHRGSLKRRQFEQTQLALYGRVLPPRKQARPD